MITRASENGAVRIISFISKHEADLHSSLKPRRSLRRGRGERHSLIENFGVAKFEVVLNQAAKLREAHSLNGRHFRG